MSDMPFAVWQQEMGKFPSLAEAEDWRVRSRIRVEGLPSPWEDGPAAPSISQASLPPMGGELPPLGAQPNTPLPQMPNAMPSAQPAAPQAGPPSMNDIWGKWTQAYQQGEDLDREAAELRRQQFQRGQQTLLQQNYGPTRQERLLAMSAALLSPTQVPGFKGALMNVMPVLSEFATARRKAGTSRSQALAQLQSEYESGDMSARRESLKGKRDMLGDAARMAKPTGGQSVWSENLQRYIPRDQRVAVDTGVLNGMPTVKYSDGTLEVEGADGTVSIYGPDGKKIGTQPAGGRN